MSTSVMHTLATNLLLANGSASSSTYDLLQVSRRLIAEQLGKRSTSMDWTDDRLTVGALQLALIRRNLQPGTLDGYKGPATRAALEQWQNQARASDLEPFKWPENHKKWPRQKDVTEFFGLPGKNLVKVTTPYPLRIAWQPAQSTSSITVHAKVADSMRTVMEQVLQKYGHDELIRLGLNLFSGSYADRAMKGSTRTSMHAWGIALDWHSEGNQFRWDSTQAVFDGKEYDEWWKAWEAEGWLSLGRARDYDWMHVQAALL